MSRSARRARLAVAVLAAALVPAACVDSPAAPDGRTGPAGLVLAPSLALAGPDGAPAATAAQAGALNAAFERVDGFRIEVRTAEGALLLDTLVRVTPGQDEYDLVLPVEAAAGETLTLTLVALQGETELFRAEGIQAQASATGAAGAGGGAGAGGSPTVVTLSYSGPGVDAASVELDRTHLVVGPGGTGELEALVRDASGAPVTGVPLAWSSTVPTVATVADGEVQGLADGLAAAVVTTPTGLEARATVYVVGGELAFVAGGELKSRAAGGGTPTTLAGAGAAQPAWSADGARLFYVLAGSVRQTGVGAGLARGAWPSPHPDGTRLAFERDGAVWYVNDDGRNATRGPAGRTPAWADGASLYVSGGSIERLRADGAERETVAAGEAGPPAVGPGDAVAFVAGGELRVAGRDGALATGVHGRPSWSADGRWLVVAGAGGLLVVPSAGGAPAVPLPGLGGASQPAFRPSGSLTPPARVSATGLDPSPPVPGAPVRILGSGFDWIIPANNRVVWPTREGPVVGEILSVAPGALEALVPRTVVAGELRVENRSTGAALAFEPTRATIAVRALTPDDRPVAGVRVEVAGPGGAPPRTGETDEAGAAMFPELAPGSYTVRLQPPAGFTPVGAVERTVEVVGGLHEVEVRLAPAVVEVRLEPETRRLEVGKTLTVRAVALTAAGDRVETPASVAWAGSGGVGVEGEGLQATLTGRAPSASEGSSTVQVTVNGRPFTVPFTVTTFIRGLIEREVAGGGPTPDPAGPAGAAAASEPASLVGVVVRKDGKVAAQGVSGGDGRYRVPGLLAGTYQLEVLAGEGRTPEPASTTLTLGPDNPTGTADFLLALPKQGPVESLEVDELELFTAFGQTQPLVVKDSGGDPVAGPVSYTPADPGIVSVSDAGVVTALGNGQTEITVAVGDVTATVGVTVDQEAVSITILEENDDDELVEAPVTVAAFEGETQEIFWEAFDANGHPISPEHDTPTITSSDPSVVSISGEIGTAEAVGIAGVTVSMDGASDAVTVVVLSVHEGSLVINTHAELEALAAKQIGRIEGSLTIQGSQLTDVDELSTLLEVVGSVLIRGTSQLGDLSGLESLEWVGGGLEVTDNNALPGLHELTSLEAVGGSLYLRDNPALSSTQNLPALQTVGGDLIVEGGGSVVGIPSLTHLEGMLQVGGVYSFDPTILKELRLPALGSAAEVYIYDNPNLTTVGLGALTHVVDDGGEELRTAGREPARAWEEGSAAASVEALKARRAERDRARAERRGERRIATGWAPSATASVSYVGGDVELSGNPALTDLDLGMLTHVGGNLAFVDELGVGALVLPALESVGGDLLFDITQGPTSAAFPALEVIAGTLDLCDTQTLASLHAPLLGSVGQSVIVEFGIGLTTVDLPSLAVVGQLLDLSGNDDLTTLALPALSSAGSVEIEENDGLESLALATAATLLVSGFVQIVGNDVLTTLDLGGLAQVDGAFEVGFNDLLEGFDAPSLATVGALDIESNAKLLDLDGLSAVTSGLSSLNVVDNDALSDVGGTEGPRGLYGIGDATATDPIVTGSFVIRGNASLCAAAAAALLSALEAKHDAEASAVGGSTDISNNQLCEPVGP